MTAKIIFIPGYHDFGKDMLSEKHQIWFAWLKKELEKLNIKVIAEDYPDAFLSRAKYWLPFIKELGADETTVLIGHSTGAIAAMKFAEENKILGSVLIGTYYTDLGSEDEKASGYFDKPWEWKKIKTNQQWIMQFHSTDDPFIPNEEAHTIHNKLSTELHEFNDKGHFGADKPYIKFPELLEALKKNYSKHMSNPWDTLSPFFNTTKDENEISPRVTDNILIAWPVILDFIKKYSPGGQNLRLLEYGCGTGSFAHKLHKLGYNVTGVDSSEDMIKIAKAAYGDDVNFLFGDASVFSTLSSFTIITSVMTFQFVDDIEKTFKEINKVLELGGIFTFAVHNPEQIKTFIPLGILFEDFDSKEDPKKGILNVGGIRIPIFIRTAQEYNQILLPMGFEPLIEECPPFTKEFLDKYPSSDPTDVPEFLILGYRKVK